MLSAPLEPSSRCPLTHLPAECHMHLWLRWQCQLPAIRSPWLCSVPGTPAHKPTPGRMLHPRVIALCSQECPCGCPCGLSVCVSAAALRQRVHLRTCLVNEQQTQEVYQTSLAAGATGSWEWVRSAFTRVHCSWVGPDKTPRKVIEYLALPESASPPVPSCLALNCWHL